MRRSNELTLKEAIQKLVEAYKLTPKLNEARLADSWEKIMGVAISARTKEIYVRDKKLYILLSSSVLKKELMYSREKIIQMVNEEIAEDFISEVVLL